jgi:hypothetical protein
MTNPGLDKDRIVADLGARNVALETLVTNTIASLRTASAPGSGATSAEDMRRRVRQIAAGMEAGFLNAQMESAKRVLSDREPSTVVVLPFGAPAPDEQVPA